MDDFFKKIDDIKKNPKKKALAFFAFYFIFFVLVILFIRFSSRKPLIGSEDYESGRSSAKFSVNSILENNYIFGYEITLDGVTYKYYGQRYDKEELFEYQGHSYYRNGNQFYLQDGVWKPVDNPYLFKEFLDVNQYAILIEQSTYESKTSYEDGRDVYNYLISSNTINQKLYHINSDFLEEPNKISIRVSDEGELNEIEFTLNSYCTLNRLCQKSLKIKLQYDMFGEVKKIDNPVR